MTRNLQTAALLLVVLVAGLAFADKKEDWLTHTRGNANEGSSGRSRN